MKKAVSDQIAKIPRNSISPPLPSWKRKLDNQGRFSKRRFVVSNLSCSSQLVTRGVRRFRFLEIQQEHGAFRGQVGEMIGSSSDCGTPNSHSRAGRNVLLGGAGWTGWRRGQRAGAAGSPPAAPPRPLHAGTYQQSLRP